MAKKFVVAMMMHETNTFSPLPTPISSFARATDLSGPLAIKEFEGTNTSLGGFIEVTRKAGAEFTVPMAASANPSGLVTKAAYEQMKELPYYNNFFKCSTPTPTLLQTAPISSRTCR